MNLLALGSIIGAFSDIPLGTKLLFIVIIIAIIAASKGGKNSGGGSYNGSSGASTPFDGGAN